MLVVLAAIVLCHVVLAWMLRAPGIAWGEDDAAYLQLAEQLRHLSYREIHDIGAPIHARFPPGYPLIIAVLGWPFGDRLDWLLALNVAFTAGAIVLLYLTTRRFFGDAIALVVAALFALNPAALWDSGNLMSEASFGFLLMLALWALAHEDEGERYAVLAALSLLGAALTRTAGVAFLVALFLYWIARRQYRRVGILTFVCAVTVGAWLVYTFTAPNAADRRLYAFDLGVAGPQRARLAFLWEIVQRLPIRLERLATQLVPSALALPTIAGTRLDNVLWLAATVTLGAVGLVALLRRWAAAAFMLLAYGAMLLMWRYALERFLSPIIPLLFVMMLVGASALAGRLFPRRRGALVAILATLLLAGAGRADVAALRTAAACDRVAPVQSDGCWDPSYRAYLTATHWVRDSTPSDAVFFVNKERAFYQHTGRKTINQDRALRESPSTLAAYLRERGAHYAVAAPVGLREREHYHLLAQVCQEFVLLRSFAEDTFILRLRASSDPPGDRSACEALSPYLTLRYIPD